jgi:hypothetical protein
VRISESKRLPLAAAGAAVVVLGLLLFLFTQTQDYGSRRQAELLAKLVDAKAIDTRWDMAVAEARGDARPRPAAQAGDVENIHAALDGTAKEIPSRVMKATVAELKGAFAEKNDLVGRFLQANGDARQALAAAMRADAAIGTQVRASWREFPQRDRLVGAENLVARTLAHAQAYSRAASAENRASLQSYAADLGRVHELPRPIQATLSRLETDIHQLLLLKPLEQTIDERLAALGTGGYLDELTALVQRKQLDEATQRSRYRAYLLLYLVVLMVAAAYGAVRAIDHYRLMDGRQIHTDIALAEARRQLAEAETPEAPPAQSDLAEVVDIVVKPYRVR